MPTYTYGCKACGHEFDVFHGISATPKIKCESCASTKVERHIGTGGGIIFKGSGFYETDYKSKRGEKPSETKTETKTESKTETKSEGGTKTESKPEGGAKSEPKAKGKAAASPAPSKN
jgi:putative FmdB family regulatory protein